jgi:hypothetical protein
MRGKNAKHALLAMCIVKSFLFIDIADTSFKIAMRKKSHQTASNRLFKQ